MANPILSLVDKHLGPHFVPRLKQHIVGLAEDFWKDGELNLLGLDVMHRGEKPEPVAQFVEPMPQPQPRYVPASKSGRLWSAAPGEISEKMWGEGFVTPGDVEVNKMLIAPLGLNKQMSVLDLSAGLGGRMRLTAEETGAYITGFEPDPSIAERGMQLSVKAGKSKHASITHYDPSKLVLDRSYDCVLARETFYRVPSRGLFYTAIAKHTKPRAQLAFTDYVVDPEYRDHPAMLAWKENEKLANPIGLDENVEAWAKVRFSIRVHEDLSDYYKAEVIRGMGRLMKFLASDVKPDAETGQSVLRRIDTWKYRLAAMDAGMKFYRFYGTKS